VVLKDEISDPSQTAAQMAQAHGLGVGHVYSAAIKGFSATIPEARLRALKNDQRVKYVEQDQENYAFAQTLPTGVNRIAAERNPNASINGVDERVNVDVAIIDSGIQGNHPDLYVVGGVNYTSNNRKAWGDGHGHGTHVAGSAAAKDNDIGVVGVAPGARLWAVRVLDNAGSGYNSWSIAGVDWVTANAGTIEVANMSLGGGNSPTLNQAIARSVARGVTYVVAAGNSAVDAATTSPANNTTPGVITVSAIADSDGACGGVGVGTGYGADDTLASFSNFGSAVDIAAPGVSIYSTYPGSGYAFMSGTSMAAPHVAGAAALYIAKNGRVSPHLVEAALKTNGVAQGDSCVGDSTLNNTDRGGFTGDKDGISEPLLNVAGS
jgi:subtilisin family serine protease